MSVIEGDDTSSAYDQENVAKASQTANLLAQDLRNLLKPENPLLAEIALETLQHAVQIEQGLKRIESITRTKENTS